MSRAFPVILARSAAKAGWLTPELKVTTHPAGGYCIAEKQPGSGIALYRDPHASKAHLERVVAARKKAAIQGVLHGQLQGIDEAAARDLGQSWLDF